MRRSILLVLGAAALLAPGSPASAGGGGGGGGICPPAEGKPPARTVWVRDSCFTPETLHVRTGKAVTWVVHGGEAPHTVTAEGMFDSGELFEPFRVRFDRPGRYVYYCAYHGGPGQGMFGEIVVKGPALGSGAAAAVLFSRRSPSAVASPDEATPEPAEATPVRAGGTIPAAAREDGGLGAEAIALLVGVPLISVVGLALLLRRGRA